MYKIKIKLTCCKNSEISLKSSADPHAEESDEIWE